VNVVVSDTTPLNYLILIGEIRILPLLFEKVFVPPAVIQELKHPRAPVAVSLWASALPTWVEIRAPRTELELRVGKGENEAISLALELPAATLLVDDMKAKTEAESRGLVTLGTLAVLDLADGAGLMNFETAVAHLRATSFYLENSVLESMLAKVRARKSA
jgi:predicted nucleic acid-binding protein